MDVWLKVKLGFVILNVVNIINNFILNVILNNYNVLKIFLKDNMYFLVENCVKVGYDVSLLINFGGIVVWYIDEFMNNNFSDLYFFIDIE